MSNIKITALTDIGNNIAPTTLVPVVDMAGTPTTKKSNLQNAGNLILSGAGGSNFVPAARATLAQSVTNAAQPNITSVGTLTSLTVSGNTNLGSVSNITITGGSSDQVLTTNGNGTLSWTAKGGGSTPGGSNGQIQFNNSGNFDGSANLVWDSVNNTLVTASINLSNVINSTGNQIGITPGANANGSGPTWTFDASGGLYWPASGGALWVIEPSDEGEFEIRSTSNVVISTDISNANSSFTFDVDGIFTAPSNVNLLGSRLNVGPDAANVANLLNPTLVIANTGSQYIQAAIINNDAAGSSDWSADGAGGGDDEAWTDMGFAGFSFNDPTYTITEPGDGYLLVQGYANGLGGNMVLATGDHSNTADIIFATGGFSANAEFARIDHANNVFHLTRANSGIQFADGSIQTTAGGGSTGNVTFDDVTVQGQGGQLFLSPDPDFTANLAYVRVRAGDVASHIHMDTGNNEAYDLFLGDDNKFVQASSTGNIIMSSYDSGNATSYAVTLDTSGLLSLPGGAVLDGSDTNFEVRNVENVNFEANAVVNIYTDTSNAGYQWQFGDDGNLSVPDGIIGSGNLTLYNIDSADESQLSLSGSGVALYSNASIELQANVGNVSITTQDGTPFEWVFDDTGNLTLPGNTVAINFANGATAFGNVVSVNLDGNSSNVLRGDGTFSADIGAASGANGEVQYNINGLLSSTGNFTFVNSFDGGMIELGSSSALQLIGNGTVQNPAGNVVVTANGKSWSFKEDGNLNIYGNILCANTFNVGTANSYTHYDQTTGGTELAGAGNVWIYAASAQYNFSTSGVIQASGALGIESVGNIIFGIIGNANSNVTIANTGVTISGNIAANNLGNIISTDLDGNASNILYGNGVFAAPPASSYGDSNVVSLLGSFGSNTISTTGNVATGAVTAAGKIGYSAGNTVTQTTSRATGVTLNALSGEITLFASSMTAGQVDFFTMTNSEVAAGDMIICTTYGGSLGTYLPMAYVSSNTQAVFTVRNLDSFVTAAESPVIKFIVVKAPTA